METKPEERTIVAGIKNKRLCPPKLVQVCQNISKQCVNGSMFEIIRVSGFAHYSPMGQKARNEQGRITCRRGWNGKRNVKTLNRCKLGSARVREGAIWGWRHSARKLT